MDGFGGRLRAAMLAAGMETPAQLAERCGGSFSRQTAAKWLKMKGLDLKAAHLLTLAKCLGVRMRWLADGTGPLPPRNKSKK